jgi:hypothetical protein
MAKKFLKTYEAFMLNRKFKFEEEVIDPILELIRDNQEFLTKPENLPQLAKLGYMYNSLWYSGRVCWGSSGLLLDPEIKKAIEEYDYEDEENSPYQFVSCEDNPKYKIEMCNPQNDDIENLIYDAWGMHVSDEMNPPFEEFSKIVKEGVPLTELEKKELKINKTFEDWVEIKLDPTYKYKSLYPDRKRVADHLLCTIGNGYGWNKEGYIIEEASGADQDKSIYGDWRNAKFSPEIKPVVDKILSMPEVKETLDTAYDHINGEKRRRKEEEDNRWKDIFKNIANKSGKESAAEFSDEELDKIIKDLMSKSRSKKTSTDWDEPETPKYSQYYPISSSSKIYAILDKETKDRLGIKEFHKSYVDAAIEICKDILEHESEEREANVKFAKKLLTKFKISDYSKEFPKEADKYELEQELKDILLPLTDHFNQSSPRELKKGDYSFYLNDTKTNQYANNNYYLSINIDGLGVPKGLYNNIECLKSTSIYQDLKDAMNTISNLDDIYQINIGVDNVNPNGKLYVEFVANKDYVNKSQTKFDEYLISKGFQVGQSQIALELNSIILACRKPTPLGDSHPHNKTGMDIFSNAHDVSICDKSWNKIGSFNIDERGFNTININKIRDKKLSDWIQEEFNKMKLSDPEYGLYRIKSDDRKYEGKRNLYAHDFFLWLKDNQ